MSLTFRENNIFLKNARFLRYRENLGKTKIFEKVGFFSGKVAKWGIFDLKVVETNQITNTSTDKVVYRSRILISLVRKLTREIRMLDL